MTTLSLREAAQQAGTSKSTIFRAVRAGRLSAARTDDGGFAIDPAELFRVYPPKSKAVAPDPARAGQDATAIASGRSGAEQDTKVAVLETEQPSLIRLKI